MENFTMKVIHKPITSPNKKCQLWLVFLFPQCKIVQKTFQAPKQRTWKKDVFSWGVLNRGKFQVEIIKYITFFHDVC